MISKQRLIISFAVLFVGCAMEQGEPGVDAQALGHSDSALCKNALSAADEKTALKLIDDICGDTWCEGDNNFAFDRLSCKTDAGKSGNGGSCTLKFRIIPRVDDPPSYSRSCTTTHFNGFESLVETAQSGYQSLNWDFYLTLTECINRLEAELPR